MDVVRFETNHKPGGGMEFRVVLLNGTELGAISSLFELESWVSGLDLYRRPVNVQVPQNGHLAPMNGGPGRHFKQLGTGFFKPPRDSRTQVAIISFINNHRRREIALVPTYMVRLPSAHL